MKINPDEVVLDVPKKTKINPDEVTLDTHHPSPAGPITGALAKEREAQIKALPEPGGVPGWGRKSPGSFATYKMATEAIPTVAGIVGGLGGAALGGLPGGIAGSTVAGSAGEAVRQGLDVATGVGEPSTPLERSKKIAWEGGKQGLYDVGGRVMGTGAGLVEKGLGLLNIGGKPAIAAASKLAEKAAVGAPIEQTWGKMTAAELADIETKLNMKPGSLGLGTKQGEATLNDLMKHPESAKIINQSIEESKTRAKGVFDIEAEKDKMRMASTASKERAAAEASANKEQRSKISEFNQKEVERNAIEQEHNDKIAQAQTASDLQKAKEDYDVAINAHELETERLDKKYSIGKHAKTPAQMEAEGKDIAAAYTSEESRLAGKRSGEGSVDYDKVDKSIGEDNATVTFTNASAKAGALIAEYEGMGTATGRKIAGLIKESLMTYVEEGKPSGEGVASAVATTKNAKASNALKHLRALRKEAAATGTTMTDIESAEYRRASRILADAVEKDLESSAISNESKMWLRNASKRWKSNTESIEAYANSTLGKVLGKKSGEYVSPIEVARKFYSMDQSELKIAVSALSKHSPEYLKEVMDAHLQNMAELTIYERGSSKVKDVYPVKPEMGKPAKTSPAIAAPAVKLQPPERPVMRGVSFNASEFEKAIKSGDNKRITEIYEKLGMKPSVELSKMTAASRAMEILAKPEYAAESMAATKKHGVGLAAVGGAAAGEAVGLLVGQGALLASLGAVSGAVYSKVSESLMNATVRAQARIMTDASSREAAIGLASELAKGRAANEALVSTYGAILLKVLGTSGDVRKNVKKNVDLVSGGLQ